jgi:hypothetical protein
MTCQRINASQFSDRSESNRYQGYTKKHQDKNSRFHSIPFGVLALDRVRLDSFVGGAVTPPVCALLAASCCPDLDKPRWDSIGVQNEVGDWGKTGHATVETYECEVPPSAFSAHDHFVSFVSLPLF